MDYKIDAGEGWVAVYHRDEYGEWHVITQGSPCDRDYIIREYIAANRALLSDEDVYQLEELTY
jgi:hypothetical protein